MEEHAAIDPPDSSYEECPARRDGFVGRVFEVRHQRALNLGAVADEKIGLMRMDYSCVGVQPPTFLTTLAASIGPALPLAYS
jgi:hypothetical protein